jgi:hypothetical protein
LGGFLFDQWQIYSTIQFLPGECMSRFAFTREDPEYYIDAAEWEDAFPDGDYFLEESDITVSGISAPKSSTFVLHTNTEELSPFSTVNS